MNRTTRWPDRAAGAGSPPIAPPLLPAIQVGETSVYVAGEGGLWEAVRDGTPMFCSKEGLLLVAPKIERSSRTYLLTGLPNRRGFTERAKAEIKRARRNGQPLCLGLCDVDLFKSSNDRYGHDAGDFFLRSFAALLEEEIRESDAVARWGGEEFIFLFPDTDLAGGCTIAEKIRRRIEGEQWRFLDLDRDRIRWDDIVGVLRFQRDDLDRRYLEYWAAHQEATELLRETLRSAGFEE